MSYIYIYKNDDTRMGSAAFFLYVHPYWTYLFEMWALDLAVHLVKEIINKDRVHCCGVVFIWMKEMIGLTEADSCTFRVRDSEIRDRVFFVFNTRVMQTLSSD